MNSLGGQSSAALFSSALISSLMCLTFDAVGHIIIDVHSRNSPSGVGV